MARKKLKPLLPSLKERQRYIAFELVSQEQLPFDSVSSAIWDSMLNLIGTKGTAEAGLQVLPECYRDNKGVLRVSHTHVHETRASLAFMRTINNTTVIPRSVATSGMLNKVKKLLR